jgi:hypothetical protein
VPPRRLHDACRAHRRRATAAGSLGLRKDFGNALTGCPLGRAPHREARRYLRRAGSGGSWCPQRHSGRAAVPLRSTFARYVGKPAVARARLDRFTSHGLRHSFVAILVAAGCNVRKVSEWAGHNSVAFTLTRYGALFEDGSANAVDHLYALRTDAQEAARAVGSRGDHARQMPPGRQTGRGLDRRAVGVMPGQTAIDLGIPSGIRARVTALKGKGARPLRASMDLTNAQIGALSCSSSWTSCHGLSMPCVLNVSQVPAGSLCSNFRALGRVASSATPHGP